MAEENENLTPEEAKKIRQDYNFILRLAANDQTGSIREFWQQLKKVIKDSQGNRAIISSFVDRELPKVKYFEDLYGAQAQAAIDEAQPALRADVERAVDLKRQEISRISEQNGITLAEGQLDILARDAWRNNWQTDEIITNLRPFLAATIEGEGDLTGRVGDFEQDLMAWASRNGLSLSRSAVSKYLQKLTMGTQSIDDVKDELRKTYLSGMYPGWADRINEGFDPEDLFEPYRDAARRLLEVDDVSLDDNLMKSALQQVDEQGKPVRVPLYQFEQQVRKDPRWQKTNNAYESYSRFADEVLSMFGLG